jgi:hypothetical protein
MSSALPPRAFIAVAALLVTTPTQAAEPQVLITANSELHFGTFMVFGSGARTVSATGAVSDSNIVALEGRAPAPAYFTISYDRGNENNFVLDIVLDLVISAPPLVRQGGVEARLSGYETNLPGALRIDPGRAIRLTMSNCRTRVCTRTFQVGGRLDVTRQFGGAAVVVPIPVDVTVISAERVR